MARATTAYVSRFQRTRVMRSGFVRGDVFTLGANLNAALDSGDTVASVVWQVSNPNAVILGDAAKTDRAVSVEVTAGIGGGSWVKATVTSTNGAVFTQLFEIGVAGSPWFEGETAPAMGPYSESA